jgi:ubiquinone/menaquinone biosynthesis C-methylase UbiE
MTTKVFANPSAVPHVQTLMDDQKAEFNASKAAALERGIDVMADRITRYRARWKEALAYAEDGASVLDIGAGWMPPAIFDLLINDHRLNYHALDIDVATIREMATTMASVGLPESNFKSGEVSVIPFHQKFDLVFSSHCLEHSVDIVATLLEIRRVLREGGHLFMSVPLGFDDSNEHLMFLGPSEWISLLTEVGFTVCAHTTGTVYVEQSDLTVLAKHEESTPPNEIAARALAERYSKANRTFLTHTHEAFAFGNEAVRNLGQSIVCGVGTTVSIAFPVPPRALIIERHPWSGFLHISDGSRHVVLDAYHHIHYRHGVDLGGFGQVVTVEIIGANPLSKGCECVIAGALI